MRYHVDILKDVGTAKGWSTIVDPMVCETKTNVYWARACCSVYVTSCGETVAAVAQRKLGGWTRSPACKVALQSLCGDILGEYVGRVVICVDFDDSHDVVWDQLLYEQVSDVNVLCFSWWADSCCHALPLEESVWILMLTLLTLRSSIRRFLMCKASVAPVLIA